MSTPRQLGKYELLERLGHGGVAEVWKAYDTRLHRHVAVKLLQPNLRDDPDFLKRFEREAQLIASLHHPNIMQIHDFQIYTPPESPENHTSPIAYMVMDYVEGQTLADYIHNTSSKGQIPSPTEIVNLFISISQAIDYAHQKGMIHRDIKPANILLDRRNTSRNPMGEPILTDFGVAKMLSASSNTMSGAQLGTPLYISPEQARGYPGNERSDLYSLGVILYEMVTGVTPFRGNTPLDVMTQHINATPPTPSLINPQVPPTLTLVVMRSLDKDPAQRFPSAMSMTIAIAEALHVSLPEGLVTPRYPEDAEHMPTLAVPLAGDAQSPQILAASNPASLSGTPQGSVSFTPKLLAPSATNAQLAYPTVVAPQTHTTPAAHPTQYAGNTPQWNPGNQPRKKRGWLIAVTSILVVLLIASTLGAIWLVIPAFSTPANPVVGSAFYVNSGQHSNGTAQGIADQLRIYLRNIPAPAAGKSYYAWLLPDKNPERNPDDTGPRPIQPPLLLTNNLPVTNNTISYFYTGTPKHDNLLSTTSRLLITEEDSGRTPAAPSTDNTTWRYYAEIPQEHITGDRPGFSALTHIRHLFYNETNIEVLGLPGGLDFWMSSNTERVLEWSISARDYWHGQATSESDMQLMTNQFIRILDYLDGSSHVQVDVPPTIPVFTDPVTTKVALLSVGDQLQAPASSYREDPPGYVDHVLLHVGQVAKAPNIPADMLTHTRNIQDAVAHVKNWLNTVRKDTVQLFQLRNQPDQLRQDSTRALLDDLETNAQYAYLGQLNPATNTVRAGVIQAHYEIMHLAALEVTKNVPKQL